MEWSVQEIARLAGTTSRTLRHYDDVGILKPSRVGENGYRFYDQNALVQLTRILLLRELGLGLPAIAQILQSQEVEVALKAHLAWLRFEESRLAEQILSVQTTLARLQRGEPLMAHEMFKGFSQNPYRKEAVDRFGASVVEESEQRLAVLDPKGEQALLDEAQAINIALAQLLRSEKDPSHPEVQGWVARHHRWVSAFWTPNRDAYMGLGKMYVEDSRFAAFYDQHAPGLALFLSDAMAIYAEAHLD